MVVARLEFTLLCSSPLLRRPGGNQRLFDAFRRLTASKLAEITIKTNDELAEDLRRIAD